MTCEILQKYVYFGTFCFDLEDVPLTQQYPNGLKLSSEKDRSLFTCLKCAVKCVVRFKRVVI